MIKKILLLLVTCTVLVGLTGCGIGGFWMNGNPNLSESVLLRSSWQKDSRSTAGLTQDWVECGGDDKGYYYVERSPTGTGQSYQ